MSWFKKNKTKKKLVTVSAVLAPVKAPVAVVKGKCFWLIFVLKNISLIFGWEDWGMWSQKRFTSGLLIFVLAPDISTIILAFLRRRFSTESGFNSGKFLSYLAISLLLKGLTLTATLTASSVDIFCSFRSPTTKCVSTKTAPLNGFLYLVLSWFPASSLWSGARSAGVLEGPG